MAAEPWNRVNIPFPSAVSGVRIPFDQTTDAAVKAVLVENENVLKITQSEILQTEIRVLYELLYILNNSSKGNKTFKSLKQVEQCVNRLNNMKLDAALQGLTDLCPNRIKRGLGTKTGECDVPSQPMLEWLCLKVLGAAQLMNCTLNRLSTAFILTKQQMKWEEFVILNVVITSMLSRLWVIFRAVMFGLSALYQQLLKLLKKVAHAQPMPFLTDFSLPADMTQLLSPSGVILLVKQPKHNSPAKGRKEKTKGSRIKSSVEVKNTRQTWKVKEDLGVAVERDTVLDADMKPFLRIISNFTEDKSFLQETDKANAKKQTFKKQVRGVTTFSDMATQLEEIILWCKSEKMEKEKRLLTFLRLKCQKMRFLEAEGYKVQRKLLNFRQEACWALCPQGSASRTCGSSSAVKRNVAVRSRFQSLRSRFKFSMLTTGVKKEPLRRRQKQRSFSASGLLKDSQRSRTSEASPLTINCHSQDDIDDIFASVGL